MGEFGNARITNMVLDYVHTATIRGTKLQGSTSNYDCFPVRLMGNISHRPTLLDLSKHSIELLPRIRITMIIFRLFNVMPNT
jgi:hypothetical protein